jgi:hypothetical protein
MSLQTAALLVAQIANSCIDRQPPRRVTRREKLENLLKFWRERLPRRRLIAPTISAEVRIDLGAESIR